MPASSIDSYLHDARKNFDAVRPAPVYADINQTMGQCQNIHISTNRYYGYHSPKTTENLHISADCEMLELPRANGKGSSPSSTRKRCADNSDYPQSKRLREEEQREKNIEPETNERDMRLNTSTEDLLANLYWNTHGGNIYQFNMCL